MGQPKLTLYSPFIQPPNPLLKHYHQAIRQMLCTLCTKRGIPCIGSLTATNACDAYQQAHKKCLFVVQPFRRRGWRISRPRHPCEDSCVVDNDESIPEQEWTPGPQTGDRNDSGHLALFLQASICPPPS
ncbi:hypothetical protein O181_096082 [Austropuccinia psidii MF-1]|uniref:Uncharacterized protein n=1 Tax=Austropuccinia psidii MF-1 TaxID=1389203 RepID=A0A9Q3J6L0_9BASI|nr:hypothetical protein [Austropuccinia psidii MF-1]